MNALDLLDQKEKKIFVQMLRGQSVSEVAENNRCKADAIKNIRLQIIAKLEQSSALKSPETRRFQN